MIQKLKTIPLYVVLLPLFFVWHGFAQNYGFIDPGPVSVLALVYYLDTILLFIFFYWLLRNYNKAALIVFCCMCFFFFFGNYIDLAKAWLPRFFHRYIFTIPVFLIFLVTLFAFLKRTDRSFPRLTLFLNSLLLIYLLVDTIDIIRKIAFPYTNKLEVYDFARNNQYTIPDTCGKPDIYLLLFDEYESSSGLKSQYNFNNDLDSFLLNKGFSIQTHSKSNYNYTNFSMASMLNMDYVKWFNNSVEATRDDYMKCNQMIKENNVIKFLSDNGYEIVNLSIFDLAGEPATIQQSFLPLQNRMITNSTLPRQLYRDFVWVFLKSRFLSKIAGITSLFMHEENNNTVIQRTNEIASSRKNKPRFVYSHFFMPHFPFFKDKNGNRKSDSTIFREFKAMDPKAYLDYIVYVNSEIRKLVEHIQKESGNKAVILLMGDHGFRKEPGCMYDNDNLNAVYLPNRNYNQLRDTMTCVNQFRVVFNTLYNQHFPILPDTSICLVESNLSDDNQ
ncbi:MAG: sulfatase-like hydrolase/transferase [Chitinophagaceae bacterium]